MSTTTGHRDRVAAALRGALAVLPGDGAATDLLATSESIAAGGGLDAEDLRRRHLTEAPAPVALLVRALAFGLASPGDRPRLRRDSYRCASAAGADEGTALVCVAAALVAADIQRFDPATTALRVRQSLLEDAPMALLDRLTIRPAEESGAPTVDGDPGATLQLALSAQAWEGAEGARAVLERLPAGADADLRALAAALAGAASGSCDLDVDPAQRDRADAVAAALGGEVVPAAT